MLQCCIQVYNDIFLRYYMSVLSVTSKRISIDRNGAFDAGCALKVLAGGRLYLHESFSIDLNRTFSSLQSNRILRVSRDERRTKCRYNHKYIQVKK